MKNLVVIVLIATAFVASFFSFSIAADKTQADKARILVRCVEVHLTDLRQRLVLLDIAEDIILTVLDNQKKLVPIHEKMRSIQKELEKLGLSSPPVPASTWGEKEEQALLQKIEEIKKEKEEAKRLELEAVGMLNEARALSRELHKAKPLKKKDKI